MVLTRRISPCYLNRAFDSVVQLYTLLDIATSNFFSTPRITHRSSPWTDVHPKYYSISSLLPALMADAQVAHSPSSHTEFMSHLCQLATIQSLYGVFPECVYSRTCSQPNHRMHPSCVICSWLMSPNLNHRVMAYHKHHSGLKCWKWQLLSSLLSRSPS